MSIFTGVCCCGLFFRDKQQASKTTLLIFCLKMSKTSNETIIKKRDWLKKNFEAKQNLLGFFDLLLKISTFIAFLIFAIWLILQNEYFYSLAYSIFLLSIINCQKLKKFSISSFRVEFFNPKEHKK